jgi:hypothetical protein
VQITDKGVCKVAWNVFTNFQRQDPAKPFAKVHWLGKIKVANGARSKILHIT